MATIPSETETPLPDGKPPASRGIESRDVVPIIGLASGVVAVLSGQQPTGNLFADIALTFAFGAAIPWLAHTTQGRAVLVSAVMALFFTGFQLPAVLIGVGAVLLAVVPTTIRLDSETVAITSAAAGAMIVHTALNLPNLRFAGSASLFAFATVLPIIAAGYGQLSKQRQRQATRALVALGLYAVVATALAASVALSVRDRVEAGIAQAEDGVTAIEQGDQSTALALLEAAGEEFGAAGDRLSGPLTWPARLVPITAQHSRAIETAAEQGEALAATAARTVTQADVEKIRGRNGAIDLALVEAVNVELTVANRTLAAAQASLQDVNTPWLVPQLSSRLESVGEELAATAADIDLANHATAVLPQILGANGQRRYLVLFIQPAESREFGGFVGAYAILEIDQGRFNLAESGSIGTNFGNGTARFTNPQDFPLPYVQIAPEINPQNLTAVADLSTIRDAVRDLAPQWRQNPDFTIDGIITIDPYALAGMLELTGPLIIEGRTEPVDATNVVDFLLREQYLDFDETQRSERQDILRLLAGQAFNRLFSVEIPGPERLGAIFGPVARADRLAMTTFDENENLFLDRIYLSAELPEVGSAVDMLGLFSQTATASKLDAYATRAIAYDVTFDPGTGRAEGALRVRDTNNAPPDAGAYVLGFNPLPGTDGDDVAVGDNFLVLSLYTRADVLSLEADRPFQRPDPLGAFSYDRHTINYEVPLGGSTTISATLSSQVQPGRYDLLIPAQASANVATFTLRVRATDGWRLIGPPADADGWVTQTFEMDEARGFTFLFEPGQ